MKFKCDFQTTFGILLTDQQISGPLNELNDADYWLSREELLIPQYYHWSDDEINMELGMIDFAVYRNQKCPMVVKDQRIDRSTELVASPDLREVAFCVNFRV